MGGLASVLRIAAWHLILYCFVVLYILAGAAIFYHLEGQEEDRRILLHRQLAVEIRNAFIRSLQGFSADNAARLQSRLQIFMHSLHQSNISLESYLHYTRLDNSHQSIAGNFTADLNDEHMKRWTFPSSVLFAFTILTTIGYGNVAPRLQISQVLTMAYGAFGIPLFLITIADLGRWFKTFIISLIQLFYRKEFKKKEERRMIREIGEVSSARF